MFCNETFHLFIGLVNVYLSDSELYLQENLKVSPVFFRLSTRSANMVFFFRTGLGMNVSLHCGQLNLPL